MGLADECFNFVNGLPNGEVTEEAAKSFLEWLVEFSQREDCYTEINRVLLNATFAFLAEPTDRSHAAWLKHVAELCYAKEWPMFYYCFPDKDRGRWDCLIEKVKTRLLNNPSPEVIAGLAELTVQTQGRNAITYLDRLDGIENPWE